MAKTKNFFEIKKDWSFYKDDLLENYLSPYFAKILATRKNVVFIDGFAGKGIFNDGNEGSPLIIKHIKNIALKQSRFGNGNIDLYFIEYEYANELEKNLNDMTCNVIGGDYKQEVPKLLNRYATFAKTTNIFLYVDPFGIKHIDFSIFRALCKFNFYSAELLLNFNSFGFIREGCRLLDVEVSDEITINSGSYDEIDDFKNDIANMNRIANGEYWQSIIINIKNGKLNAKQAEKVFIEEYTAQLKTIFNFVLNIPIKTGDNQIPKYNMIFATNHIDGMLLMADNMISCNNAMISDYRNGLQSFFDYEYTKINCDTDIINILKQHGAALNCKDLCYEIFNKHGLIYLQKDIKQSLKNLEQNGTIMIVRSNPLTATGRPVTSIDFMKNNLTVKLK